jgi:hypothetical protein
MKPLWKVGSGMFAGWRSIGDQQYDLFDSPDSRPQGCCFTPRRSLSRRGRGQDSPKTAGNGSHRSGYRAGSKSLLQYRFGGFNNGL